MMNRDQIRTGLATVIAQTLGVGSAEACRREAEAVLAWLDENGLAIGPAPGVSNGDRPRDQGPAAAGRYLRPR